jgi:large subunit ribosomal protein L13
VRTYTPTPGDIKREWHLIDVEGAILGRVATEIATLLRGKHKPMWAPHMDTGDHVIVINAEKLAITVKKGRDKMYYRHSGFPGGLREENLQTLMGRDPERVLRLAVKGMLPKGRLGRQMLKKLRVYAGPTHPHQAQAPKARALASR